MSNEIVKYHNDLNDLNLDAFSLVERRFFFSFLYMCKEKLSGDEVVLTRDDLIHLGVYRNNGNGRVTVKKYIRDIQNVVLKCKQSFSFYKDVPDPNNPNAGEVVFFDLFYDFRLSYDLNDEEKTKLSFKIHEQGASYLHNLLKNYTAFPLVEYQSLNSVYMQALFIHLKQFRHTGIFRVSMEKFRKLLNIPPSYKTSNITQRILNPAKVELASFFPNLNWEAVRSDPRSRKITGLIFTWTPAARIEMKKEASKEIVLEKKGTSFKLNKGDKPPTKKEIEKFLKENKFVPMTATEAQGFIKQQLAEGSISNWPHFLQGIAKHWAEHGKPKSKKIKANLPDYYTYVPKKGADPDILAAALKAEEEFNNS